MNGASLPGAGPGTWVSVGLALVLVLAALGLSWRRPDWAIRSLFWVLGHTLYRLRVLGREHIPRTGPVLFVCNHVSYIDALLLLAVQPRRIRFLIWAPATRMPGLRLLLRLAEVIPIDGEAGPRAILRALQAARTALARGEAVCVFAEGAITRAGLLLPFHRGFRLVVKGVPAQVVPVCFDHVWGSLFSYRGGRFFWKWPQTLPYPVCIAFGAPRPTATPAAEVRQAIQKLSADCSVARNPERRPVHRQFLRMAARHPFRTCFIDPANKKTYRYGEALAGAGILARLLRPLLRDDEMVAVWLPSSVGGAFANLALALLRKPSVNLNYTAGPEVIRSCVRQCNIRHVLTSRLFTSKMPLDLGGDVTLIYLEDFRKDVSAWQRIRTFLAILLLPAAVLDRWVFRLGDHRIDDLASVIFSSGSTGDPKGVMLTHQNIAANAESMIQAIDPRPSDRILGVLPFFHSFGYTVTIWVPLLVGASVVYYPDPRQAQEIGGLCRTYRCTLFLTTPTFLRFCLRRCEPGDFATLRFLICGAEKLQPSLADEFVEKFGVQPLEGYGCTELSPVVACNVPDWEEVGVRQLGNRPGTIGQPIPGVAAKVVGPETLQPLPAGGEGLLLIYGANVMRGYLGKEQTTRQVIRDGWYVTGDIARIDADGFITLTGRLSRFSKIGGEMVPHEKVEEELNKILCTAERACVVTAVPDERKGERLVVLHTPLNGTDVHGLCQGLSSVGLPNLWVPAERDFYQIPELPLLGTGKVDLKRVKELALSLAAGK